MQKRFNPFVEYALSREEIKPLTEFMERQYGLKNIHSIHCEDNFIIVTVVNTKGEIKLERE